jgi:hypothetical protein
LFFNDTKSIFHHDRHCQEMAGNQLSCHFKQENRLKLNGKKVVYLPSPLIHSLQTHGIALPMASRIDDNGSFF